MPLLIVKGDITKMKCDAIVNAANSSLLGGGGVDGAIHAAAGPGLLEECRTLGGCRVGEAKLTGAYRLPAKFVIHTVGPVWRGGLFGEKKALASCYRSALELAKRQHCESVAFPLISAGVYGYPKEKAVAVATRAIAEFLQKNEMLVYLVIYDRNTFEIEKKRFRALQSVIDETYVPPEASVGFAANKRREAEAFPQTPQPADAAATDGGSTVLAVPLEAVAQETTQAAKPPAFCRRCGYRMRGDTFYCPCCGAEMERPPQAPVFSPTMRQNRSGQAQADSHSLPAEATDEFVVSPEEAQAPCAAPPPPAFAMPAAAPQTARTPRKARAPKQNSAGSLFPADAYTGTLEDALDVLDESFSEMLLRKIDERGMTDVTCYKRANIDRKLFSKIRGDRLYKPKKTTALAFAVALELSPAETRELLMKAGYALSRSSKFDIIVDYYISHGNYDIFEINEALFAFDQPLLS